MTTNVLILCAHNSARSVLGEGMLNHRAHRLRQRREGVQDRERASGRINPSALEVLNNAGVDTTGYHSKSWDEFSREGAPPWSIVITVCDSAAAEQCPAFLGGTGGQPIKAHCGYRDPSNAESDDEDQRRTFELTRQAMGYRMLQLPLDTMDRADLQRALVAISKT